MKVSYISDLHLDFHVHFNKNQVKFEKNTREFINKLIQTDEGDKEVLVIAGDLSHYNKQSLWALQEFSKAYELVLMVFGNHDYYLISNNQSNKYKNNSYNRTEELINMVYWDEVTRKDLLNVTILENELYDHKGVRFYGSTMWYPLDTYEQQCFYSGISNDSKLIKRMNHYDEHEKDLKAYNKNIDNCVDVMISHVPLIEMDTHKEHNSTACYLTTVDQLAPITICGHVHEQNEYTTESGNKVYINAIGYDDEYNELIIKSFEI